MNYFSAARFDNPLLLLAIIPAICLVLLPYLRLPKKYRRTRNKIVPTILHSVIMLLIVTILSGFTFFSERDPDKQDVVILVDVSHSTQYSKTQIDNCVGTVIEELRDNSNVGIVMFGLDTVYAATISSDVTKVYNEYLNCNTMPNTTASNIATALNYVASNILDRSKEPRIILISDGVQTDEDAIAMSKQLAQKKIRIDTINFAPNKYTNEVQIINIEIPESIIVNDQFTMDVVIQSIEAGDANVSLYDNSSTVGSKDIKLRGGVEKISFDCTLKVAGVHTIKAEIVATKDTLKQNNVFYSYIDIEGNKEILIIEGKAGESTELRKIIDPYYVNKIKSVTPGFAPSNITELLKYNEVIMMNVDYNTLPKGFDVLLDQYVYNYGGGLFTTGGKNTYTLGNMSGTLFDQFLPIDSYMGDKNMALLFIVDASGSMGGARIETAKKALKASLDILREDDYVSIISFNVKTPVGRIDFTPVTRKDEIITAIDEIDLVTGTYYYPAIKMGLDSITNTNVADVKHVIFLSDGAPDDGGSGYKKLIENAYQNKNITFSTIGLDATNSMEEELMAMAKLGGGRYSKCTPNNIVQVMTTETEIAKSDSLNEKEFTPYINVLASSVLDGVDRTAIPDLGGYTGTTLKEDAKVILSSKTNDPIYAEWEYGNGKVGSFMSTLNGDNWSAAFMQSASGKTFIKNVVKYLLSPRKMGADFIAEFSNNNYSAALRVNTKIQSGDTIAAIITDPNGNRIRNVTLTQASSELFLANLPTTIPGLYKVDLQKNNNGNFVSELTVYYTFSYSKEFNAFVDASSGFDLLKEISKITKGQLMEPENINSNSPFVPDMTPIEDLHDPRPTFLIVALVIFLLDIIARKFKFKWPHELFKKDRVAQN